MYGGRARDNRARWRFNGGLAHHWLDAQPAPPEAHAPAGRQKLRTCSGNSAMLIGFSR